MEAHKAFHKKYLKQKNHTSKELKRSKLKKKDLQNICFLSNQWEESPRLEAHHADQTDFQTSLALHQNHVNK